MALSKSTGVAAAERNRRLMKYGAPIVVGCVVVGAWQGITTGLNTNPLILPAPSLVIRSLDVALFGTNSGQMLLNLRVTAAETFAGFGIGLIAGMLLGILFGISVPARAGGYPYIVALQSFPKIALAPLMIIWLGYNLWPKILIAAILVMFPALVNTYSGVRAVEEEERELFEALGASRRMQLQKLIIPRCMSYIFPALESGIILALLGAVTAEFLGSTEGLGYALQQDGSNSDTAGVFAILLILAAMGLILQLIVALIRRRVLAWQA